VEILRSERRGSKLLLTLNRPERRNALNTELLRALERAFAEAESSPEVDLIILTGAEPSFCGGVDLRELEERGRAPEMGDPLAGLTKPLIGAINGPAITGGLELALMCDLRLASEKAAFGDTHGRVGLVPGWGAMARLPIAVGVSRAAEMLLSGRVVDAQEALTFGLVNEVVAHAALLPRALALAEAVLQSEQGAVRAMLAQLREGAGASLAEGLARERRSADAWQGDGFHTDLIKRQRVDSKTRRE
jgi:enoyl-CoA hydratase